MSQRHETPLLILSLLLTGGLLGGGYWWLTRRSPVIVNQNPPPSPSGIVVSPLPAPGVPKAFDAPVAVEGGTTIRIDGSTSMAKINKNLQEAFEGQFAGTQVIIDAQGSDKGILQLLLGKIDIAAVSSPLTAEQKAQGLVAVPVRQDAIALVVGRDNPYRRGLTQAQVRDIFQGKITNWSELGGPDSEIRVFNRPAISGTHQVFQQLALQGQPFGTTPNIVTLERDATTPILQALGKNGISYATYAQVAEQQTVRVLPVDGLTPEASNYPYQRTLYYVYKEPPSPGVVAFLGFVTGDAGQAAIKLP